MPTFTETFSDADGTNLNGKATTTGGGTWTVHQGSFDVTAGQGRVTTAAPPSSVATVEAGFSDFDMFFDITIGSSIIDGAFFRVTDLNNYLRLDLNTGGDILDLISNTAGVETLVASGAIAGLAVGQTAILRVIAVGNSIQAYWAGTLIINTTTALHQTATKHGIIGFNTATRYDNYSLASVASVDARLSRENVEVLVFQPLDARISRENVEALIFQQVDARVSRENVEVLVSEAITSIESWGSVPI